MAVRRVDPERLAELVEARVKLSLKGERRVRPGFDADSKAVRARR